MCWDRGGLCCRVRPLSCDEVDGKESLHNQGIRYGDVNRIVTSIGLDYCTLRCTKYESGLSIVSLEAFLSSKCSR